MYLTKNKTIKYLSTIIPEACILFAVFFVLLPPTNCEGWIHSSFQIIACVAIWSKFIAIHVTEKVKKDRLLVLLAAYTIIVLISTVINRGNIKSAVWQQGILCITIYILFEVGYHENGPFFFKVFYFYLITMIVINLIKFPFDVVRESMADKKLLAETMTYIGHPNIQIVYFMPALYCGYYLYKTRQFTGKSAIILYVLLYAFCIACTLYFSCMGNLFVLAIWGLMLIIGLYLKLWKIIDPWFVLIANLVLFLVLQMYDPNQPGVIEPLLKIMNRTPTFTGRTDIWAEARRYVSLHPFYGAGFMDTYRGFVFASGANHGHSVFINALIKGGIPSFMLLIAIMTGLCVKIKRNKCEDIRWGAVLFCICILLNLQFDVYALRNLIGFVAIISTTMDYQF